METECSTYLGFPNIVRVRGTLCWHCPGPCVQAVQCAALLLARANPFLSCPYWAKTHVPTEPSSSSVTFLPPSLCPCGSPTSWPPIQDVLLAYLSRSIPDSTFLWWWLWLLQPIRISLMPPGSWNSLSLSHKSRFLLRLAVPPTLLQTISNYMMTTQLNSQTSLSESKSGLAVSSLWGPSSF